MGAASGNLSKGNKLDLIYLYSFFLLANVEGEKLHCKKGSKENELGALGQQGAVTQS